MSSLTDETLEEVFSVGSTCLDPGITLIEASAGTGKTFAIAGMVVRLVAEKGYRLSEILVVTFTEAATRELRDRVRNRIREAVILLEQGLAENDPALAGVGEAASEEKAGAIRHLKNALLSFDEAAIFTIHGFCQRMLRENAFETGALFDVELVTDAEPLWRETAEDFWRKEFYAAGPEIAGLVVALQEQGRLSTSSLVDLLRKVSRHPELRILSGQESFSLEECQAKLTETIGDLREEWLRSSEVVGDLLRSTKALSVNKKTGYPEGVVSALLKELDVLKENKPLSMEAMGALRKLSARRLERNTTRQRQPPEHPFFELCAEWENLTEAFVRLVRIKFMDTVQAGLAEAKKRRNVITFDDLLTRLYEALRRPGGDRLGAAIGRRFKAALIDEFQDTDPVQWEVFYRVFGSGGHILFLIGDPKQAIYAFRGADIFTYMEARNRADARYTLGTNWRSDEALVEGANQLFSRHDEAFVFPEIAFSQVAAAEKNGDIELDLGKSEISPRPLQLACVSSDDGAPLTVGSAKERIVAMMVAEINRLLTSGVRRNGRELAPGDIAVLVRTHREAESVRAELVGAGIPSVVRTDRSVLQTDEAEHILRLLAAILEPHKNGLVKAALVTPLFGMDAAGIHAIDHDEHGWEELTAKFHHWREVWGQDGFMRMFRNFLAGEALRVRLLALPDGERMVTNYQHIAECLHSAEYERILTPSALLRWLREQGERTDGEGDSYVIRLDKDEEAVQIVTIHRSKGLEYPVVFCPFNWTGVVGKASGKDIIFHDPKNQNRLTWDMREEPDAEHVEAFRREQLAEAMRLLYVAVTRARNRCYLFWAVTKESGKAADCALAQAFGCGRATGSDTPLAAMETLAEEGWGEMHDETGGSGEKAYQVAKVERAGLKARTFGRSFSSAPLITSFSGLTARAHDESADHDVLPEALGSNEETSGVSSESGPSIFTFPKGAKAGNFFHGLLESIDFTCPQGVSELVKRQLRAYRFDPGFEPAVTEKLLDLLELPLPGGVKLADVAWRDRLVETPFYFPIQRATPLELAKLFRRENLPAEVSRGVGRLKFHPVDGYMTGFIDLVIRHGNRYYVTDWKSNWLGAEPSCYGNESLRRAMAESHYYLQYHLYTLALHQHLERTLPGYDYERDFGGVFYVFLRGVDRSDPSSGIFYDRPSGDMVEQMVEVLMPKQLRNGVLSEPE